MGTYCVLFHFLFYHLAFITTNIFQSNKMLNFYVRNNSEVINFRQAVSKSFYKSMLQGSQNSCACPPPPLPPPSTGRKTHNLSGGFPPDIQQKRLFFLSVSCQKLSHSYWPSWVRKCWSMREQKSVLVGSVRPPDIRPTDYGYYWQATSTWNLPTATLATRPTNQGKYKQISSKTSRFYISQGWQGLYVSNAF